MRQSHILLGLSVTVGVVVLSQFLVSFFAYSTPYQQNGMPCPPPPSDLFQVEVPPYGINSLDYYRNKCHQYLSNVEEECRTHFVQHRWQKTFVVVTGARTGSSTLQVILNCGIQPGCNIDRYGHLEANPDVLVTGENEHVLFNMWDVHRQYKDVDKTPSCPFYSVSPPDYIPVKEIMQQGNPCRRILGYKEIRWTKCQAQKNCAPMGEYLDFLRSKTRGLKLIFLHRDPGEMYKSLNYTFFKNGPAGPKYLMDSMDNLHKECQERKIDSFYLEYDDLKAGNLKTLFGFLEEEYDQALIDKLLALKHSF